MAKDLARTHAARLLVLHVQETGITHAGFLADENEHIPVALERVVTQLRNEGIDAELVAGKAPGPTGSASVHEELTSVPLSPHEEPLSPYEEEVLAALEEEFRVEDSALAAALTRTPPSSSSTPPFLLPLRHVLHLLAALVGLIAAVAFGAGQLGVLGVAAVTCAAVVPWLVRTACWARRRSRAEATPGAEAARGVQKHVSSAWSALPTGMQYGVLPLAVVLFLVGLVLMPTSWRAVLGVALWLVVLPLGLLRLFARPERRDTSA
jgi:hypothetical protein